MSARTHLRPASVPFGPANALALGLGIALLAACGARGGDSKGDRPSLAASAGPRPVKGRVVDLAGLPVAGARVATAQGTTTSGPDGRFSTPPGDGPRLVTISRAGYVPRARAATPERELLMRLTNDPDGDVVTLAFGGDTMFARRYYDPDENGDVADAIVKPGAEKRDFPLLLRHIEPFLRMPDLTAVNFESPLLDDARVYLHGKALRDPVYHPTKAFAFASSPVALDALKGAGVDVIDLANNHTYDALEVGVATTLDQAAARGFPAGTGSFGLGRVRDEAWAPAYAEARARNGTRLRVAFAGCTTIAGKEHAVDYVAGEAKGGAAACDEKRVAGAVRAAKATADVVVFMVHGGKEYERNPTEPLRRFTEAAVGAGADLLVNHHSHVVSGFERRGDNQLVAWGLGNLLFDQTVWPTFEGYMLFVQYKGKNLLRAYVEPLTVERFSPKPVTGSLADHVAGGAAGRLGQDFLVEDGTVELLPTATVQTRIATAEARSFVKKGRAVVEHLDSVPLTALRVGRDLLWVGRFENETLGTTARSGPQWLFEGPDKEISPRFASFGSFGAGLWREPRDDKDIILTPKHRFLAEAGEEITILGRARTSGRFRAEISWYKDTKGASYRRDIFADVVPADGRWHEFRIDVRVPADITDGAPARGSGDDGDVPSALLPKPALGVYFRLAPEKRKTEVGLDDIKVIEWAPVGTKPTLEFTHSMQAAGATVALRRRCQTGGCR